MTQGKSQDDLPVPFSELVLCAYFVNCAGYRKGRGGTGLKLASINSHLSAIKSHCRQREAPIIIFNYTVLERLIQGLKYHQSNRTVNIRYAISYNETGRMIKSLLDKGDFESLIWALGIAMAWGAALRTSE